MSDNSKEAEIILANQAPNSESGLKAMRILFVESSGQLAGLVFGA